MSKTRVVKEPATQKEELVQKTKHKIIELFGPESALAQAMEDEDFFDKLGELIAWLYGEIILTQPRPEPYIPIQPRPGGPYVPRPEVGPWVKKTTWVGDRRPTADDPARFGDYVRSAMSKSTDKHNSSGNMLK